MGTTMLDSSTQPRPRCTKLLGLSKPVSTCTGERLRTLELTRVIIYWSIVIPIKLNGVLWGADEEKATTTACNLHKRAIGTKLCALLPHTKRPSFWIATLLPTAMSFIFCSLVQRANFRSAILLYRQSSSAFHLYFNLFNLICSHILLNRKPAKDNQQSESMNDIGIDDICLLTLSSS